MSEITWNFTTDARERCYIAGQEVPAEVYREFEGLWGRLLAAEGVIEASRHLTGFLHPVSGTEHDEAEAFYEALRAYDVDRAVRSVVTADQETPE